MKGLLSFEMQSFVLFVLFVISNTAETSLDATNAVTQDLRLRLSSWIKAEPAVPLSSVAAGGSAGGPIKQRRVPSGGAVVYLVCGLRQRRRLQRLRPSDRLKFLFFFFNNNLEIVRQEDDSRKEPQGGSDPQHRRGNTSRLKSGREKFCPNNRA